MVSRTANAEGAGEVPMRMLVRQALRMRPDRIVVGEVRRAEVVDPFAALNTSHEGCARAPSTRIRSRDSGRMEALAALGGSTGRRCTASWQQRCASSSSSGATATGRGADSDRPGRPQ